MMTSASSMPRNIPRVKYVAPATIIKPAPPSQIADHVSTSANPSRRNSVTSAPSSTSTTRRPRPPQPKPIFYSETNRRDTTTSSQNPFRPPSPLDFPQTNRPGQPPQQMFGSSKQHAYANTPFRPPVPPPTSFLSPVGAIPGFEPQLIPAESQLGGLAGVHVLPDGGLLLPAPQLAPQYPPTVPIPPPPPAPAVKPQGSRPKGRKVKRGKKFKKPKKDRYGIEIGGGHSHSEDDDDGSSGITLSLGGGGDRKHVSPLSIAKHIFLPFLPKPKVNLNGRVVFGVVLENAAKFGHKKLHPGEEPQAVADISLNGHSIHDHS
ncbi:hypothetical protein BIW11_14229 [Tropilaelaps mercedesae]|uniref:Uncharacterized protein n=1 Tax=Tropilaelaps mercedesae TaxID=418985 RepID=A0A1V9WYR9_9ACAR|nr:hypothetical protein BIW11_14229 [Tropilaelaps mercedesae]